MPDPTAARFCSCCGLANQCTVAAGGDAARCWCQRVDFSGIELPSDRSRCLCPPCAEQLRRAADETCHAR